MNVAEHCISDLRSLRVVAHMKWVNEPQQNQTTNRIRVEVALPAFKSIYKELVGIAGHETKFGILAWTSTISGLVIQFPGMHVVLLEPPAYMGPL